MMLHQVNMALPINEFGNAGQNKIKTQQYAPCYEGNFIQLIHLQFASPPLAVVVNEFREIIVALNLKHFFSVRVQLIDFSRSSWPIEDFQTSKRHDFLSPVKLRPYRAEIWLNRKSRYRIRMLIFGDALEQDHSRLYQAAW